MDKKQHNKTNSQNNWIDPFYLNELLTEEELSIQKTTQNYCKTKLLPNVIEYNKKCFFDKKIYGDEINHTSETEEELRDETNPNEYEENKNKIEYMERTEDLKEVTTDEEEFRTWDGIDEDWQEINKKNDEKYKK